MPRRSQAATDGSQVSSCAGAVATHSQPLRRIRASIACSRQKSSISPIAVADARARRRPSSSPSRSTSVGSFAHHDVQKPPLRPLAPPPQMSASTMTTSQSGSSRLIWRAVQRPGVAAADDAHVRPVRADERGTGRAWIVRQRLLEPH